MLRAVVGGSAFIAGLRYFIDSPTAGLWMGIAGVVSILGGILLLIGFLTPVASLVAAAALTLVAVSQAPSGSVPPVNALVILVAIATALLGPGALSIDARLFGRREIIIPSSHRNPKA